MADTDVEKGAGDDDNSSRPLLGGNDVSGDIRGNRGNSIPLQDLDASTSSEVSTGESGSDHSSLQSLPEGPEVSESGDGDSPPKPEPLSWIRRQAVAAKCRETAGDTNKLLNLNSQLLEAVVTRDFQKCESLLAQGANPNVTSHMEGDSACHIAASFPPNTKDGEGDILELLLRWGAERVRQDMHGCTPLHIAAWSGNARSMATLLHYDDATKNTEITFSGVNSTNASVEHQPQPQIVTQEMKFLVNESCVNYWLKSPKLPEEKYDFTYNCKPLLPGFRAGWTALHVAGACSSADCAQLLLASGADVLAEECSGLTPLDVAGSYDGPLPTDKESFAKAINILIQAGGRIHPTKCWPFTTPLHKAAELESLNAIHVLLNQGASAARQDSDGWTPLHVCVEKRLEKPLEILANSKDVDGKLAVDVQNSNGQTALYVCVIDAWMPGIRIALKAGADVTKKMNLFGCTPFHLAASKGNIDILNELLHVAKEHKVLNVQDEAGATPLFSAIESGHFECVKAILREGASIDLTLRRDNANVFHKAAERGHKGILESLIVHDNDLTHQLINAQCNETGNGYGPIHLAAKNNNDECLSLLLNRGGANIILRASNGWTPLHVAAFYNNSRIANTLIYSQESTAKEIDNSGWLPLHIAARYDNKDTMTKLIQHGHDVASLARLTGSPEQKQERRTALDMIFKHVTEPIKYLQDVFDSMVTTNVKVNLQSNPTNNHLKDLVIKAQYSILKPGMDVVKALLRTGNAYEQKRLLLHPLLESYLYYKWKALMPLLFPILVFYTFFLISITIFVVSVFFYNDTKEERPRWLDSSVWRIILIVAICLVFIQELLYINVKSLKKILFHLETWVKIVCYVCSMITATIETNNDKSNPKTVTEWSRHVVTIALTLSWIGMMILISKFPKRGFYVLMFGKVATNILKILFTFLFLLIGFSLSFMIQFHTQPPFDGPWSAFVKTVVMTTTEYDYGSLFQKNNCTDSGISTVCEENMSKLSTVIAQIFFLAFLVLAGLVLMNLMIGVAVNDLQSLEIIGNTNRLEKQVELLKTMDNFDNKILLWHILPKKWKIILARNLELKSWVEISNNVGRRSFRKRAWEYLKTRVFSKNQTTNKFAWFDKNDLPLHIKDALVKIAMKRRQIYVKETVKESKLETAINKVAEIHNKVVGKKEVKDDTLSETMNSVVANKDITKPQDNDMNEKLVDMGKKINQMASEIDAIKQFMARLESKLEKM